MNDDSRFPPEVRATFTRNGMKIEPGYYKTRSGAKARVLCVDAPGEFPLVGYMLDIRGDVDPETWCENGHHYREDEEDDKDLLSPWIDEEKLVPHWPAIWVEERVGLSGANYHRYWLTVEVYTSIDHARKWTEKAIRLATEYPPIMLSEKKA